MHAAPLLVLCGLLLMLPVANARGFPVPLQFPQAAAAPTFSMLCEWLQRISLQLDPSTRPNHQSVQPDLWLQTQQQWRLAAMPVPPTRSAELLH